MRLLVEEKGAEMAEVFKLSEYILFNRVSLEPERVKTWLLGKNTHTHYTLINVCYKQEATWDTDTHVL